MPEPEKSTCAHCGEPIVYAPHWVDTNGEAAPKGWRHLQHDRPGAVACATRPEHWEADEWPIALPTKFAMRVTVRVDFADGTSNELVAENLTEWLIGHSAGEETAVMEHDGEQWVSRGKVLPQRLRLEVAWDEPVREGAGA